MHIFAIDFDLFKFFINFFATARYGFNEELTKRIRKYRKNMVGYSTIIDVISIALIKMAQKAEINYHLDVIEIPKIFFDKNYQIHKDKVKPLYYEEALEKWN